jgi:hypothetical protein
MEEDAMSANVPIRLAGAIAVLGLALGAGMPRAVAAEPVAFRLCVPEGDGAVEKCGIFGDPATYVVPAKQQLTIEQVSGDCSSPALADPRVQTAEIVAQTGGTILPHQVLVVTILDTPGGTVPVTNVRVYADPGSIVTIGLGGIAADPGGRFCRLVFSGQLVRP